MKKFIVLIVFSAFLIGGGLTIKEKIFYAGEVLEGTPIVHEFTLENRGKKPVNIKKVIATCGCTTVGYDRTIPQGGKGRITLNVRTTGYQGNISKRAIVYTDDPDMKRFTLTINAVVKPIIRIKPNKFIFIRKKAGKEGKAEITLSSDVYPEFKITKVSAFPQEAVKAEYEKEGKEWKVKLLFSKNLKLGQNRGYVRIWTNIKKYPAVWINYLCEVEGKIKLVPDTLSFYRNRGGINFRVVTINTKEKGIKIELKKCPEEFNCFLHRVSGGYILLVVMEKPSSNQTNKKIELISNVKNEENLVVKTIIR